MRLLRPDALKDTITQGVEQGEFGYALRRGNDVVSIRFKETLDVSVVEFADDAVLVLPDAAAQLQSQAPTPESPVVVPEVPEPIVVSPGGQQLPLTARAQVPGFRWSGNVPLQKWTSFYTKVLSHISGLGGVTVRVDVRAAPGGGVYEQTVEDVKRGLSDLELPAAVEVEPNH